MVVLSQQVVLVSVVALFCCINARSTVSNVCSDVCDFYEWGREAMCQERNLVHIPQECKDAKTLQMQDNLLQNLPNAIFRNFSCLKYLYLERNNMSLDIGAFRGCSHLQKIHLSQNYIPKLTQGIMEGLSKVEIMFIDNALVQEIEAMTFRNTSQLHFLSLENNKLTTPPCDAFQPGNSIQTLYLSFNRISHLPSDCFRVFSRLTNLYLRNNPLVEPNPQAFRGLDSLLQLDLQDTNLSRVPTGIFPYANKIEKLYLSFNNIRYLLNRDFVSLPGLKRLYLHQNQILTVHGQSFEFLSSLQFLDLSNNSIKSIGEGALGHSTQLQELMLQHNLLNSTRNISFAVIPDDAKLNITYNPLHCDCDISPFRLWLENASALNEDEQAMCSSPPKFVGQFVRALLHTDICSENRQTLLDEQMSVPSVTVVRGNNQEYSEGDTGGLNVQLIVIIAVATAVVISLIPGATWCVMRKRGVRTRGESPDLEHPEQGDPVFSAVNVVNEKKGDICIKADSMAPPPPPPRHPRLSSTSSTTPLLKNGICRLSVFGDAVIEEPCYTSVIDRPEQPPGKAHEDPTPYLPLLTAVDHIHDNKAPDKGDHAHSVTLPNVGNSGPSEDNKELSAAEWVKNINLTLPAESSPSIILNEAGYVPFK